MIAEVRSEPFSLEFFKLPKATNWNDVVFISMGDQSHSNRPQGDSTGGLLTLAAGPDAISGKVTPINDFDFMAYVEAEEKSHWQQ